MNTNTTKADAIQRLNDAQILYDAAQEAVGAADAALAQLRDLQEKMKPLMAYYDQHWLDDYAATEGVEGLPEVSGEDEIFNLHGEHYRIMRELLALSSAFFTEQP